MNEASRFGSAVLVLVLVAVAGCGSSAKPGPATTTSTTTAGSATTAAPGAASTTTTSGPATTSSLPPAAAPCTTGHLSVHLGPGNGAAGTIFYPLVFTNTGTEACTLRGYPGVSFVTGPSGTQVGAAASRTPGTVTTVTLSPGQSAPAELGIAEAGNFGTACGITQVPGLRVYPPNQTASLYVAHAAQACSNSSDDVLQIRPVGSS